MYACVSVIAFRHRSHVFSIYVFVCEYHLECLLESSGALFGFVPNDLLKATNPQQKQTKNHYSKHSLVCLKHSTTKTSDRFFLHSLRPIRLNGKRDRERKGEEGNLNNEYSSHEASMCPNTISLCVCLRS